MKNNRFVFVVPCFNAEKTIDRMLMSVFCQTHDNWIILIRDDMSTDKTIANIKRTCERNQVAFEVIENGIPHYEKEGVSVYGTIKVYVDKNTEKFWEVKNVLAMINHPSVKEDDIICRLDGDDFLCNLCALQDINVAYNESNADCLWTAHRWAETWQNISQALPDNVDVYKHPWVSSHLKTFRKSLISDVNDKNFRGADGGYIRRAGDQAIYLPVLHKSKRRVFLPSVCYYYTIDLAPETFQTDDAKFQLSESEFLRQRGFVENR